MSMFIGDHEAMKSLIPNIIVAFYVTFLVTGLSSCSRMPIKSIGQAMRKSETPKKLIDSLSKESFFNTLKKHIEVMSNSHQVNDPMVFGSIKISKSDYINSLKILLTHQDDYISWINSQFDFYEVYGKSKWGEILSTGYYEPMVLGAHQKTNEFSQPLYSIPSDLITIKLKSFASKLGAFELSGVLQGRIENKNVIPYFNRQEIDQDNKLRNQNLELAWVSPLDAFFIQIQGSGVVDFGNGEKMRVGYDGQNGLSYFPLGKYLKEFIPIEKMSMQKIRSYLLTLSRDEQQKILNKNPSYVFFKKLDSLALTFAGMEVSNGRTIATDVKYFPKGALAFLDIDEPQFNSLEDSEPLSWLNKPRLVFDEDTGGAIKGPGRVDLYMGEGDVAAQRAGVMKRTGKLFYLVPKQ